MIACLSAGSRAEAADPQSLSSYVPVQVEDALPVRLGTVELQTDDRFTQDTTNAKGSGLFNVEPVIKLGALPGLQLDVSTPYAFGDQSGHNLGSAGADALYQFNQNELYIPSFAVHAYYASPFGAGHKTAEYTLRGIATKYLGGQAAPRIDVQFSWYHYTQPSDTARRDQLEFGIATSMLVSRDAALVIDFVRGAKTDKGADQNLVDAGIKFQLDDTLAVTFGGGVGIAEKSPEFRVLVGLQKDIKVF